MTNKNRVIMSILTGEDIIKLEDLLKHFDIGIVPSVSSLIRLAIRELHDKYIIK